MSKHPGTDTKAKPSSKTTHEPTLLGLLRKQFKEWARKPPALTSLAAALPPPDTDMRDALLGLTNEAQLVQAGVQVASDKILADVRSYIPEALYSLASLSPDKRHEVLVADELFPILSAEAAELQRIKVAFDEQVQDNATGRARSAKEETAARKKGIAARDSVYSALRGKLTDAQKAEAELLVGTAEDNAALARGMLNLAGFVERLLSVGDAATKARLAAGRIDAARVEALRAEAAKVDAAAAGPTSRERVDERQLDAQDGRVLFFLGQIDRALVAANRHDSAVLVPRLPNLAKPVRGYTSKQGGKKSSEPTAAPALPELPSEPRAETAPEQPAIDPAVPEKK